MLEPLHYMLKTVAYSERRNCNMECVDEESRYPTCAFDDWILQQFRKFAREGRVAQTFADDGSSWTYEELLRNSVHVAAGLRSLGINTGDMVSFTARNSHELYAVVIGCVLKGVIVVPSIPEMPPNELRQNFLIVKPKVIISGNSFIPSVNEAINSTDSNNQLHPKPRVFEIKQLFNDAVAYGSHADPYTYEPARSVDPKNQILCCSFSSGTTGRQKAVSLTAHGLLRLTYVSSRDYNITDGTVFNTSQLNWISWWFMLLRCTFWGRTRIFVDDGNLDTILEHVHKYKPKTMFCYPPMLVTMVRRMEESPSHWDLSSVTVIISGGDMMNKFTHERVAKKFPTAKVCQEYGTTEIGVLTQSKLDLPVVYGSIGKPLSPCKLVEVATGKEIMTPNTPDEVVAKWLLIHEYVNNPEATASMLDENGWFKTGDVAIFDESGNYFIVDRIKEMFLYCGSEIYPCELEHIIMKLPGVKDVAVTAKSAGTELGHVPAAFVVKEENCNITEQDVYDCVAKEKLDDAKRLRGGVIFTKEIPRNVNGKIVRAKLREILNPSQPSGFYIGC